MSPHILCVKRSVRSSEFDVETIEKLKLKNTTLIRMVELPLKVTEEIQFLTENAYQHQHDYIHYIWDDMFGRFATLFAGFRYVYLMRNKAGTGEIVRKDKTEVERRKNMRLALRIVFCDGKDSLEMVMRD